MSAVVSSISSPFSAKASGRNSMSLTAQPPLRCSSPGPPPGESSTPSSDTNPVYTSSRMWRPPPRSLRPSHMLENGPAVVLHRTDTRQEDFMEFVDADLRG